MSSPTYIPALRYNWLTQFYDTLISITFPEKRIKNALIRQALFNKDDNVLDFGASTATLSIMAQQQFPSLQITGLDIDERILNIASKKIKNLSLPIRLQQYDGEHFPFPDGHFDKVLSSLVFHHLSTVPKKIVLKEILRVLKPGGELHVADFGKGSNIYTKLAFGIFRRVDGEENTRANASGLLPNYISDAGFKNVQETAYINTAFGTVVCIKAVKK